jgi:hypothetical protein
VSYSGLSESHRRVAKHVVVAYCEKLLSKPDEVHYTQGAARWSGIDQKKNLSSLFPFYGDCSSTATFILWRALTHVHKGVKDRVNGAAWKAGYTGTIASHGLHVLHDANIQVGDLILYGPGPTYEHVTVALGGGKCFSHGSEGGPYILPLDYRSDRGPTHRFI